MSDNNEIDKLISSAKNGETIKFRPAWKIILGIVLFILYGLFIYGAYLSQNGILILTLLLLSMLIFDFFRANFSFNNREIILYAFILKDNNYKQQKISLLWSDIKSIQIDKQNTNWLIFIGNNNQLLLNARFVLYNQLYNNNTMKKILQIMSSYGKEVYIPQNHWEAIGFEGAQIRDNLPQIETNTIEQTTETEQTTDNKVQNTTEQPQTNTRRRNVTNTPTTNRQLELGENSSDNKPTFGRKLEL